MPDLVHDRIVNLSQQLSCVRIHGLPTDGVPVLEEQMGEEKRNADRI